MEGDHYVRCDCGAQAESEHVEGRIVYHCPDCDQVIAEEVDPRHAKSRKRR